MTKEKAGQKSFLVEVTPITSSAAPNTLSYFSSLKVAPGTLVKTSLRKSLSTALVLRCRDVKSAKAEIRRAGFLLKKIRKSDILEAALSEETLKALRACATYYATSIGTLLSALLPKFILESPELFLKPPLKKKRSYIESRDTLLLQMESEERFAQYRALVRQSFARGASVIVVVPTHFDLDKAETELSKGIAEFVYVFSLEEKKAAKKTWALALEARHPILFITTPMGLLFNRPDLDTIIVERENSRAYRLITRPYLHARLVAEKLAAETGRQLVLGDSVLSLETLWREKQGEYSENSLIRWRLPASPTALVDASAKQNQEGHFEIFSRELKTLVGKALDEREGILLFGARKGLAPTTVCGDCGYLLPCLNCGAPVVLHRQRVQKPAGPAFETVYICHACRERRESATTCGYCGSWKLVPLGIGTEEIARQARELFPQAPVSILDREHAPTDRQAQAIAEKFRATGGILVGTELAFFHVGPVSYSALVSADALFSVPDFGINERIFYLVSRLREITRKETLIQTRNIGKQVLAWGAQGNIVDFYQGEIEEREALLYPPFSIFIKITTPPKEKEELSRLKENLSRWRPAILKDSLILRVPRDVWPDMELVRTLSLLGPQFSIKVDPESIL